MEVLKPVWTMDTLTADPGIVDLHLTPEIVYHVGDQVWADWKDEHGSANIRMPILYTMRMNTRAVTVVGEYLLAAALSPKNQDGFPDFFRKVMVFVKCEVFTVGR